MTGWCNGIRRGQEMVGRCWFRIPGIKINIDPMGWWWLWLWGNCERRRCWWLMCPLDVADHLHGARVGLYLWRSDRLARLLPDVCNWLLRHPEANGTRQWRSGAYVIGAEVLGGVKDQFVVKVVVFHNYFVWEYTFFNLLWLLLLSWHLITILYVLVFFWKGKTVSKRYFLYFYYFLIFFDFLENFWRSARKGFFLFFCIFFEERIERFFLFFCFF